MPRLSDLSSAQRNRILMRPVPINSSTPWTTPGPVDRGRLTLITTAGLHHRDDTPFVKYDRTYRVISSGVREEELLQSQSSIGFDRSLRMRDINVVFPIDRLRELVADGTIGALTPHFYSMVGAQNDSESTAEAVARDLVPLLREQGTDLVLITPTCQACTHTGAVLARQLEDAGFATVAISMVREYTVQVRPPRSVFVPFPFGAPVGLPDQREQQLFVLRAALATFSSPEGPVLVDAEVESTPGYSAGPVQASMVRRVAEPAVDVANEASIMRRYYEQWLEKYGGRTAVGLTGIPVVKFRGVIRSLQSFLDGGTDLYGRPDGVSLADFLRYCSDDLKAMYLEGRIVMKPDESPDDAARWLWGETALGELLVRVKNQMETSDDETIRDAALGIAR